MYGFGDFGRGRYGQWSYLDLAATRTAKSGGAAKVGRVLSFAAAVVATAVVGSNALNTVKSMSAEPVVAVADLPTPTMPIEKGYRADLSADSSVSANAYRVLTFAAHPSVSVSTTVATIQHSPTLGTAPLAAVSDTQATAVSVLPFAGEQIVAHSGVTGEIRKRYEPDAAAPAAWEEIAVTGDIWTPVSDNPPVWQEIA